MAANVSWPDEVVVASIPWTFQAMITGESFQFAAKDVIGRTLGYVGGNSDQLDVFATKRHWSYISSTPLRHTLPQKKTQRAIAMSLLNLLDTSW
jgi:hypothetical protein